MFPRCLPFTFVTSHDHDHRHLHAQTNQQKKRFVQVAHAPKIAQSSPPAPHPPSLATTNVSVPTMFASMPTAIVDTTDANKDDTMDVPKEMLTSVVKANGTILLLPFESVSEMSANHVEQSSQNDKKTRKLSHPRIKYSGIKNTSKPSASVADDANVQATPQSKPFEPLSLSQEQKELPALVSPLNLDKLFPHVMSAVNSFAIHPHYDRSISGEADDMTNYADIDDIELPDGSKIGYPTDMKRFSSASDHAVSIIDSIGATSWCLPATNSMGSHKSTIYLPATRLSFSSETSELIGSGCGIGAPAVAAAVSNGVTGGGDDSLEIYACRHCGKTYRWKSTLRRHENDECGDKKPMHECPYCPYKAKQRGNLGVHVRKHHSDQPQLECQRKRRSTLERTDRAAAAHGVRVKIQQE